MIDKKKLNSIMKENNQGKQPKDPNMTIEVRNPKVEEQMKLYASEKTVENLNQLIEKLRLARVLVPANLNEKKQPMPCRLKGPQEEAYLPIYTSKEHIPDQPKSEAIMNVPYLVVNQIAARQESNVEGVVINPFSDNLIFKRQLVEKIEQVEKQRKNGTQKKTMKLTPAQYAAFERRQFEFVFLPKQFFEQGKQMLDELCDAKEEYIDRLFEQSYQQTRMYPYLPEDFSVMVMNISEELLLVRVDLPDKDMGVPSCWRVYLAWNDSTGQGRYFTIEKTKEHNVNHLGEIGSDWKHMDHGASPAEGAELQWVLDLIQGTGND